MKMSGLARYVILAGSILLFLFAGNGVCSSLFGGTKSGGVEKASEPSGSERNYGWTLRMLEVDAGYNKQAFGVLRVGVCDPVSGFGVSVWAVRNIQFPAQHRAVSYIDYSGNVDSVGPYDISFDSFGAVEVSIIPWRFPSSGFPGLERFRNRVLARNSLPRRSMDLVRAFCDFHPLAYFPGAMMKDKHSRADFIDYGLEYSMSVVPYIIGLEFRVGGYRAVVPAYKQEVAYEGFTSEGFYVSAGLHIGTP